MVVDGWILLAFVAWRSASYGGWSVGTIPVLMPVAILLRRLDGLVYISGYQIACSVHRFSLQEKAKAV